MEASQLRHAVYDFLNNLNYEQIKILDVMILRVAADAEWGHFLSGYIDGLSVMKFDICPGCGEPMASHDPSVLLPPINSEGDTLTVTPQMLTLADKIDKRIDGEQRLLMDLYGLDDVWDIEREVFLYFQCTQTPGCPSAGCGMQYFSIEDRMLRPPGLDGCSGCQVKSAHG